MRDSNQGHLSYANSTVFGLNYWFKNIGSAVFTSCSWSFFDTALSLINVFSNGATNSRPKQAFDFYAIVDFLWGVRDRGANFCAIYLFAIQKQPFKQSEAAKRKFGVILFINYFISCCISEITFSNKRKILFEAFSVEHKRRIIISQTKHCYLVQWQRTRNRWRKLKSWRFYGGNHPRRLSSIKHGSHRRGFTIIGSSAKQCFWLIDNSRMFSLLSLFQLWRSDLSPK